jgi:hypothetical protein
MQILLMRFVLDLVTNSLGGESLNQAELRIKATELYNKCRPSLEICVEQKKIIDSLKKPAKQRLVDYYYGCRHVITLEETEEAQNRAFPYGVLYGPEEDQLCKEIGYKIKSIQMSSIN